MVLTIEQAVKQYLMNKEKVKENPSEFVSSYKEMLVDFLLNNIDLVDKFGQTVKAFDKKENQKLSQFTAFREKFDNMMYDYAKECENKELAKSIKRCALGKHRQYIKISIEQKMEILPKEYNKVDKANLAIYEAVKAQDNLDMPEKDQAKLFNDAAQKVKDCKPSFIRWIFQNRVYNERMAKYIQLETNLLNGIKTKCYPIFIQNNFGSPARIAGLNLESAKQNDYVLKDIEKEYNRINERTQDKSYTDYPRYEEAEENLEKAKQNVKEPLEQEVINQIAEKVEEKVEVIDENVINKEEPQEVKQEVKQEVLEEEVPVPNNK